MPLLGCCWVVAHALSGNPSLYQGTAFPRSGSRGRFRLTFRRDPLLHDRREVRRVVRVFLTREEAVARVLQHGEVVRLVHLTVAGIDEAVLDLADPPTALFVAHAPVVRELLH